MSYKNKEVLRKLYARLGSTRKVGKAIGKSNGTVIYWMRKHHLPRIPKLHLGNNNSAKGRLGELYILGHPFFKNSVVDTGLIDDKHPVDLIWRGDRTNVKTCHYPERPLFRIKNRGERHKVRWYVCLYFNDATSPLVPEEVWIIPSNACPYTSIAPGIKSKKSKYHKYKLSLLRGQAFSVKEEEEYNKKFFEQYRDCLKGSAR